jgi:hypothetical protein
MKKFLLPGILAGLFLFLPLRSQANPLDVPTGGSGGLGWIPAPDEISTATVTTGYFVDASTFGVSLTTPSVGYQYCVSHVVVTAPTPGFFEMWWSSGTLLPGTTDFIVSLSSGVPYDTQWSYRTPYCAPQNDLLNFFASVSGSTMTVEGYSFKGFNP